MGSKWSSNRAKYTQWMADMVVEARKQCDAVGVQLEYDIWSWFYRERHRDRSERGESEHPRADDQAVSFAGHYVPIFNTGAGQYDRATDLELAYAKKKRLPSDRGTETIQITPTNITYYYSGKDKLIKEAGRAALSWMPRVMTRLAVQFTMYIPWYALMTK